MCVCVCVVCGAEHTAQSNSRPAHQVLFDVDATNLQRSFPVAEPCFSTVCFMFPALGKKGRIDLSRKLLQDSCVSVAPHLQRDGMMLISLAPGQGGTDAELPAKVRIAGTRVCERACA